MKKGREVVLRGCANLRDCGLRALVTSEALIEGSPVWDASLVRVYVRALRVRCSCAACVMFVRVCAMFVRCCACLCDVRALRVLRVCAFAKRAETRAACRMKEAQIAPLAKCGVCGANLCVQKG